MKTSRTGQRRRILILSNNAGGLLSFRGELIEQLSAKGYEVFFCVPGDREVDDLIGLGGVFIPCELLNRHGINPFAELMLLHEYWRIIRNIRPDIVLTYTIKPNIWGGLACTQLGVPYVANITGLGTAVECGGALQQITVALYKLGLRNAKKVFFQNVANQEFMIEHNAIHVPYDLLPGSGVNLKRYEVLPYPVGENVNFCFISRIMKQKGVEEFLDAADYIVTHYSNVEFHVYGNREDEYDGRLDDCVRRGIVDYHGHIDDVRTVHQYSSCTIHPTYYPEGMSNVLLESCACARPIITTNRPGCREIVEDGVNGYVVNERDSDDLIDKIERFLRLSVYERMQMGLAGRSKVEREFSRQIVVQKYLDEIETL